MRSTLLSLRGLHPEVSLHRGAGRADRVTRRPCVFCPADERFVLDHGRLRLSARELTATRSWRTTSPSCEKYVTHLPVHSLRAAAASEPAGEWGPGAQEQAIETLGWVRVDLARSGKPQRPHVRGPDRGPQHGRRPQRPGGRRFRRVRALAVGQQAEPERAGARLLYRSGDRQLRRQEVRRGHPRRRRTPPSYHARLTATRTRSATPTSSWRWQHEDDITVVARVVQALSPDEYARQPRPPRRPWAPEPDRPGRAGQARRSHAQFAERFFEAVRPAWCTRLTKRRTRSSWQARLVCLDAESGGLCVETRRSPGCRPLPGSSPW